MKSFHIYLGSGFGHLVRQLIVYCERPINYNKTSSIGIKIKVKNYDNDLSHLSFSLKLDK